MTTIEYLPDLYRKHVGEKANIIFDIGSRDGNDAAFLSEELSCSQTYVFEAHPECYKYIKENHPQLNVFHVAVSNFTGTTEFNAIYTNLLEAGISSMRDRNDNYYTNQDTRKIEVNTDTMNNLIDKIKIKTEIDLVKVDVEGCSYEVLMGFGEKIKSIKMIHIELEEVQYWKDQKLAHEVMQILKDNDFILIDQKYFTENSVDQVWLNKKYLEE